MDAREASARAAKALALLDTLTDASDPFTLTGDAVRALSDEAWTRAEALAQVRKASPATRELVAHLAAKRCEKSDPFAGLR